MSGLVEAEGRRSVWVCRSRWGGGELRRFVELASGGLACVVQATLPLGGSVSIMSTLPSIYPLCS